MGKKNRKTKKKFSNKPNDSKTVETSTSTAKESEIVGEKAIKVSQRFADDSRAATSSSQIVTKRNRETERKKIKDSDSPKPRYHSEKTDVPDETNLLVDLAKLAIRQEKEIQDLISKSTAEKKSEYRDNLNKELEKRQNIQNYYMKTEYPELLEEAVSQIRLENVLKCLLYFGNIIMTGNESLSISANKKSITEKISLQVIQEIYNYPKAQDTTTIEQMNDALMSDIKKIRRCKLSQINDNGSDKDTQNLYSDKGLANSMNKEETKRRKNYSNSGIDDILNSHSNKEKMKYTQNIEEKRISLDWIKSFDNICTSNEKSAAEANAEALQVIKAIKVAINDTDPQNTTPIFEMDDHANTVSTDIEKRKTENVANSDGNSSVEEIRDKASITVNAEIKSCEETGVTTDLEDEAVEVASTTEQDGEPKKQIKEKEMYESYFEFRTNGHYSFLEGNEYLHSSISQENVPITFISPDKGIQIVIANNQLLVSTQNTELDISIRNSNTVNVTDEGTQTDSIV